MSVTAESRVPALNCDNASETPQETLSEVDKEGAETQNDPPAEVPVKRKRGRPPKISVEVHVALRQAWYIFPSFCHTCLFAKGHLQRTSGHMTTSTKFSSE